MDSELVKFGKQKGLMVDAVMASGVSFRDAIAILEIAPANNRDIEEVWEKVRAPYEELPDTWHEYKHAQDARIKNKGVGGIRPLRGQLRCGGGIRPFEN